MQEILLKTPLHTQHVELGARMAPFAGYEMPIQYTGVIAESKAVREGAGMFDVSHMGRLRFTGDKVLEFLEWATTNDVASLPDMRGQYSLLPNEGGGCVDDIIVYRLSEAEYHMVVNAANHFKDVDHLRSQNKFDVELTDYTDRTAMIAVQGPRAASTLAKMMDNPEVVPKTEMFGCTGGSFFGQEVFMARSGYTGEDGFEIICSDEFAPRLWDALRDAGVTPCGLGARDVLRVEAGLPLYGHELLDNLSPIVAGLGWVVSKTKEFLGSDHINKARANGTPKKIHGVRLESKRLLSPGMKVFVEGKDVGEVTSGVYSPTFECGIAFALLDSKVLLDTPCEVDVRGKLEPGKVVSKRFYKRAH
jgi:aminomethyltransferase